MPKLTAFFVFLAAIIELTLSRDAVYLSSYSTVLSAREASAVRDWTNVPNGHAGFITVNTSQRSDQMFFWFFPRSNSPVVVWLGGGPAASSFLGMVWETGPFTFRNTSGTLSLESRNSSWTESFSMLYLDNPVGQGFNQIQDANSNSAISVTVYTNVLFEFLKQFYHFFPEYTSRNLYIGGTDYAAKYAIALAHRIHEEQGLSFSLTGICLSAPSIDPISQVLAFPEYQYAIGMMGEVEMTERVQNISKMLERININTINPNASFNSFNEILSQYFSHSMLIFNIITLDSVHMHDIKAFLESDLIRTHLPIGNFPFKPYNASVLQRYAGDVVRSSTLKLAALMDTHKVLVYSGNLDPFFNIPMVEKAVHNIPWSEQYVYNNAHRKAWIRNGKIRGFYNKVGKFCRVIINNAGHNPAHDESLYTLKMMQEFVTHGCIHQI